MISVGVLRLDRKRWLAILGLTVCFALFDSFHTYVGSIGEGQPVPWQYAVYRVLVFWLAYFALLPGVFFLADRYRLNWRRRRSFLVHLAGALAFTYVHIVVVAVLPGFHLSRLGLGPQM